MKNKNLPKKIFLSLFLTFSIFNISLACEELENINMKINDHSTAIIKYEESQKNINLSLDNIIENTNGFFLKKLISYKKYKFNSLINNLVETENNFINVASSTEYYLCQDLNQEDADILTEKQTTLTDIENDIKLQKMFVNNYIKNDLRKILSDIKDIVTTEKVSEKSVVSEKPSLIKSDIEKASSDKIEKIPADRIEKTSIDKKDNKEK